MAAAKKAKAAEDKNKAEQEKKNKFALEKKKVEEKREAQRKAKIAAQEKVKKEAAQKAEEEAAVALPLSFDNCNNLRTEYPNGVPSIHPAYEAKIDRDKDNFACEQN